MTAQDAAQEMYVNVAKNTAVARILWWIALIWFAADAALGASGFFSQYRQLIFLFVLSPMVVFALAFAAVPALRGWAFSLDTRGLVFVQAVRTGGAASLSLRGRPTQWCLCALGWSARRRAGLVGTLRSTLPNPDAYQEAAAPPRHLDGGRPSRLRGCHSARVHRPYWRSREHVGNGDAATVHDPDLLRTLSGHGLHHPRHACLATAQINVNSSDGTRLPRSRP